eukprot:TRINITY_DN10530_c0_g1_i2.p1 TRINITY_DN10530_c0_g1~~TRINITY_DN10530_c0_g1_i2.p1  ORF type:complete len:349 (-),score=101.95 TRINITY_DN10530_c0_g1_i2:6-1052(-)
MSKKVSSEESGSSDSGEASSSSDSEEVQIVKKTPKPVPQKKKAKTTKAQPVKRKRTPKKKKGPSKPKTPYNCWMQKTCQDFRKLHPDLAFGDLSKVMGAHWKQLDEKAKQEFVEMSKIDKNRYQTEMASFVPPSDSDGEEPPKKKRKIKQKKDPNAPKRPLNAYMFYSQEMRPKVIVENPEMSKNQTNVLRLIGKEWKQLTELQKKPYVKQAEDAKVRYTEAIAIYNKQKGDESPKKQKPVAKKAVAKKSVAKKTVAKKVPAPVIKIAKKPSPPPSDTPSKDESDDDDSSSDSESDKESEKSLVTPAKQNPSDKESEKSDQDSESEDEPSNKKDPQESADNESDESDE